jgi:alginate O-acetyltransferase complex protein AlgJ
MKKTLSFIQICVIVSFMGLILLPFINEHTGIIKEEKSNENRFKAAKPELDSQGLDLFVKNYDTYYTDNFNLRENFIKFLNQFEYKFYGVSAVPDEVLIGKEGWLFERKSAPNYKGINLFTNAEIEQIRTEFSRRTSWAKQRGIKYYIAVVPSKMEIYSELLPPNVIKLSSFSRYSQVLSLDHSPDINVIDIKKNILMHKNEEAANLYQITDDHWNELGAYYGYQAIMQRLHADFPELNPLPRDNFTIGYKERAGDLATILNIEAERPEKFIRLISKTPTFACNGIKRGYPVPNTVSDWDYEIVKANEKAKLKCLIIRDSFTFDLITFLQEHFKESVYIHGEWKYMMREDLIRKESPDIVITIILETELQKFLAYPFIPSDGNKVRILSATGRYLVLETNSEITSRLHKDTVVTEFGLVLLKNKQCAFVTSDGLYLSSDLGKNGETFGNRDQMNSWEKYTIVNQDNGYIAFKADNGKYLSLNSKDSILRANSENIGISEKFKIIHLSKQ